LVPWLGAALAAGLIPVSVERSLISGIDADLSFTWIERILIAGRVPWFYLGKLIWPANLSFLYERWTVDGADVGQFLLPVGGMALVAVLVWWARRSRGPLAALLYLGGTLLPVLGFLNVEWFVFSFVADHFQYLASLGIIVPVAAALARKIHTPSEDEEPTVIWGWGALAPVSKENGARAPHPHEMFGRSAIALKLSLPGRQLALAGAVMIVGLLGALSWRHSHTFRDSVALYTNAVARAPGSISAHYLLGVALAERPGREADAIAAFQTALRLNPGAAEVHEKLAAVLLSMPDRRREAITHLEAARRLKPELSTLRLTLANAWFDEGKALAARPAPAGDATAAYERALQLDPDFAEAHFNLGNLLLRTGRRNDAIAHFESAVRLKPDFAEAHTNLGSALITQPGRLPEAIEHFEAALRANPDYAPARNNLARARQLRD
jgi:tetratricopeptide (TPR) repeat protein